MGQTALTRWVKKTPSRPDTYSSLLYFTWLLITTLAVYFFFPLGIWQIALTLLRLRSICTVLKKQHAAHGILLLPADY